MKFEELEKILQRLKRKPLQTLLILILVASVTVIGSYTLTYIGEKAKSAASEIDAESPTIKNAKLKHALAELGGKKRGLARLFKENANYINIHASGRDQIDDLKWSPKLLIRTLDSINKSIRKVQELSEDMNISLSIRDGAQLHSKIYEEMTFKQALHESLDEKLFNLSLRPPKPEDFIEVADELKNEANEIDKIISKLKID